MRVKLKARTRYKEAYMPTPEEIAAACAKIQRTWSRQEEMIRRGSRESPFEFSVVFTDRHYNKNDWRLT